MPTRWPKERTQLALGSVWSLNQEMQSVLVPGPQQQVSPRKEAPQLGSDSPSAGADFLVPGHPRTTRPRQGSPACLSRSPRGRQPCQLGPPHPCTLRPPSSPESWFARRENRGHGTFLLGPCHSHHKHAAWAVPSAFVSLPLSIPPCPTRVVPGPAGVFYETNPMRRFAKTSTVKKIKLGRIA